MTPISRRGFITLATVSIMAAVAATAAAPRTGAARSGRTASLDAVSLTIDNFMGPRGRPVDARHNSWHRADPRLFRRHDAGLAH